MISRIYDPVKARHMFEMDANEDSIAETYMSELTKSNW
jgi:hypothetical protein